MTAVTAWATSGEGRANCGRRRRRVAPRERHLHGALDLSARGEHGGHTLGKRRQLFAGRIGVDARQRAHAALSSVDPPRVGHHHARIDRRHVAERKLDAECWRVKVDRDGVERKRLRDARGNREQRGKRYGLTGTNRVRAIRHLTNRRNIRDPGSLAGETRELRVLLEQPIDGRKRPGHRCVREPEENRRLAETRGQECGVDPLEQHRKRLLLCHGERGQQRNLHGVLSSSIARPSRACCDEGHARETQRLLT
jgi:hypothetical protein